MKPVIAVSMIKWLGRLVSLEVDRVYFAVSNWKHTHVIFPTIVSEIDGSGTACYVSFLLGLGMMFFLYFGKKKNVFLFMHV